MGTSVFYFVATLSIIFSLMVIFSKNPVHSVLYLILTFFTFTVHYILVKCSVFGCGKLYRLHGCNNGTIPLCTDAAKPE